MGQTKRKRATKKKTGNNPSQQNGEKQKTKKLKSLEIEEIPVDLVEEKFSESDKENKKQDVEDVWDTSFLPHVSVLPPEIWKEIFVWEAGDFKHTRNIKQLVSLRLMCKSFNQALNPIPSEYARIMVKRKLLQKGEFKNPEDVESVFEFIEKYKMIISGSFMIQVLLDVNYEDSDIDYFATVDKKELFLRDNPIFLLPSPEYDEERFNECYDEFEKSTFMISTDNISGYKANLPDGSIESVYSSINQHHAYKQEHDKDQLYTPFLDCDLKHQIVFYTGDNIENVVRDFDMPICGFIFDGKRIYHPRTESEKYKSPWIQLLKGETYNYSQPPYKSFKKEYSEYFGYVCNMTKPKDSLIISKKDLDYLITYFPRYHMPRVIETDIYKKMQKTHIDEELKTFGLRLIGFAARIGNKLARVNKRIEKYGKRGFTVGCYDSENSLNSFVELHRKTILLFRIFIMKVSRWIDEPPRGTELLRYFFTDSTERRSHNRFVDEIINFDHMNDVLLDQISL